MTRKESEAQAIKAAINYINNTRYDEQLNSNWNDVLSILLGEIIDKTEQGFMPGYSALSLVIDKSMETTKKDPYAEPGQYDQLKKWGERIFDLLKLPTRDVSCLNAYLKKFKSVFMGSKRRHYVQDNMDKTEQTSEILQAFSFMRKTYEKKEKKESKGNFLSKIKNKVSGGEGEE